MYPCPVERVSPNPMSNTRTVLVIDDEPAIRRSLSAILAEHFNVVTCPAGPQAIQFASEHAGEVYAAFVDYAMPTMDGSLVCSELRTLDPTISLVGFSGIENAPFHGPLFAILPKKNISTEHVLALAAMAVQSAEQRRQHGHVKNDFPTG